MKELQRKQRIRRAMYSYPSLLALLIITFFLAKGAVNVLGKQKESRERAKMLEEKAASLVLREAELSEAVRHLQTEEGIKEEIKERFSVTQEGEYVAIIVDERKNASSTDRSTWPWYKKLWFSIIGTNE